LNGYLVELSQNGGSSFSTIEASLSPSFTSYSLVNMDEGQSNVVRISAFNNVGYSGF